jgi:hypothetical protein
MESEAEAGELEVAPPTPSRPVRSARTKGVGGSFKSVNYSFDNLTSSDGSSDLDEEDDEDDGEEEDDAIDDAGAPEEDEGNKDDSNHTAVTVQAETDVRLNQDHEMEEVARAASPSRAGTRRPISGRGRKAEESDDPESSDSEFEPPKKVASKGRGRTAAKKQASPAPETEAKKPGRPAKSKAKDDAAQSSSVKVDPKRKAGAADTTPLSPEPMADTPTSTASTTNAAASKTPGPSVSITPGSSSAATDSSLTPAQKIKKKRRLLTGKGLDELGDILNGPGMTSLASPSKSLQFLPSKARINAARTPLLSGDKPPAPKEALNAIKMAFALPKARNLSPTRDSR